MWTYLCVILMILAFVAFMVSVPVCLGVLLRLLMGKTRPNLVGWFGATLILFALYCPVLQGTTLSRIMDVFPKGAEFIPLGVDVEMWALIVHILSVVSLAASMLFQLYLLSLLVGWGIERMDKQTAQRSGKFWLILCPVMAGTVYACFMFGLTSLYLVLKGPGRPSYLLAMIYRYFGWELLGVLCVAFAITMIYAGRRRKGAGLRKEA